MENYSDKEINFEFLTIQEVKNNFAELNNDLLRGKHILSTEIIHFGLLDQFEDKFRFFYDTLYGLQLERRSYDGLNYFFLKFPQDGKGRLTNPNLYYELEAKTTIVGIVLANFYYSNYFSFDKKFTWDDIKYEIESGEHKEAYQTLFFDEIRADYSDNEWAEVRKQFNAVINFFDRICLVEKLDNTEEMEFIILPTIHRIIELYQSEINDIDNFLNSLKISA